MSESRGPAIRTALREGFQNGTSKMAERVCYGYIKSSDGALTINEAEAKIVRWVFKHYLAGDSLGKIADGLARRKIPSPTGNAKWNRQALDKLLSNEKYIGCVLMQKTITEDGRQARNDGQGERFLHRDTHPAIISQEIFVAVQQEKTGRARSTEKTQGMEWVQLL